MKSLITKEFKELFTDPSNGIETQRARILKLLSIAKADQLDGAPRLQIDYGLFLDVLTAMAGHRAGGDDELVAEILLALPDHVKRRIHQLFEQRLNGEDLGPSPVDRRSHETARRASLPRSKSIVDRRTKFALLVTWALTRSHSIFIGGRQQIFSISL